MMAQTLPRTDAEGDIPAIEQFRALITAHFGLSYENDRMGWLGELLARRVRATRSPGEHHYLAMLDTPEGEAEWTLLAPDLTVAETYFFRHTEQIHALRDRILRDRMKKVAGRRPLRILSAGAASGEEAYTVAMTVASMSEDAAPDVRIDAIDINPLVLAKARVGRYRGWSLRETPEAMQQRWFTKSGNEYVIDERIRAMVRFSLCNLADDDDPFWQDGVYDLILCRNVLMYFSSPRMQKVLRRFARSMAEGGYLMLGHAESLRGLSSDFRQRQSHGTFYYQLAGHPDDEAATHDQGRPAQAPSPGGDAGTSHWARAIEQSTERVRAMASPSAIRGRARARAASRTGAGDKPAADSPLPDDVLTLFDKERFQEALNLLEASHPMQDDTTPWHLVLHALLLMHVGRIDEAEALCRRQLVGLPLQADLHHALSLCLEAAGALSEAMDSDRTASFLDPGFAMPHMHLGLMARSLGHAAASRQAFAMAQRLLPHESAQRIRLFAGGFGRDALRDLCRRELSARGDAR